MATITKKDKKRRRQELPLAATRMTLGLASNIAVHPKKTLHLWQPRFPITKSQWTGGYSLVHQRPFVINSSAILSCWPLYKICSKAETGSVGPPHAPYPHCPEAEGGGNREGAAMLLFPFLCGRSWCRSHGATLDNAMSRNPTHLSDCF